MVSDMGLRYFTGETQTPNEYYRELAQEFINQQWENGAALAPEHGGPIKEQCGIGSKNFCCIEAWVKNTVGDVTTGLKDSADFLKIYFKDITHTVKRGLMYQFNDSYWIVNDYGHFSGLAQDAGLRRCNNQLRIVDPENGDIFSIPCVVDYNMQSPGHQVSSAIITPNNHATVMVQGNVDTIRLFKLNTRYILNCRPFKLLAWQNAVEADLSTPYDTLLYLDLYLDEIHERDDLENRIADNGDWDYEVVINAGDIQLSPDSTGQLTATVKLNGDEVERQVVWNSSNQRIVNVTPDGQYQVYGEVGDDVKITAALAGNPLVSCMIDVMIAEAEKFEPVIVLDKEFATIRQNDSITFSVQIEYGGKLYTELTDVEVKLLSGKTAVTLTQDGAAKYTLQCNKIIKTPVEMEVSATVDGMTATKQFRIKTVSMFG